MWKAKLKNGKEVCESNTRWDDIKNDIVEMALVTKDNRTICLPKGMESYIQFKSASASLGNGSIQIDSRTVGFFLGNNVVKIRADEKTNNINVEVENG